MIKSVRLLFGAFLCVLTVLAPVGLAQAATKFQRVGVFAQTANDGGVTQTHNRRIAVNHATGDVYVTDTVNDRIDVYRPNATAADLLTSFGAGSLVDPFGIAIDQSTGAVYVSDSADSRVRKFTSDGAATPAFTLDGTFSSPGNASALAFDQGADQLVYIDPSDQQVKRATTAGAATGTAFDGASSGTAFAGLQDLAVTSTGEIIVVDSSGDPALGTGESRVERFAANGAHNGTLGPVVGAATVGVVAEGDQIVVSGAQDSVNNVGYATISLFTNGGVLESTSSSEELYSIITGIAADDGASGRLYVAADTTPLYSYSYGAASVQAYEPFTLPTAGAPTVTVTGTGAHLSATINPEGGQTSYRFELSSDGSSWTPIDPDSDGDEDAGNGSVGVTVETDVPGLDPATPYFVRLVAIKNATEVPSDSTALVTDAVPAVISDVRAFPSELGAQLRAKINPRLTDTTWTFEYGPTTGYGKQLPLTPATITAGLDPVVVSRTIGGLTASTTYHYRVTATNAGGTTNSPDQTFTTATPSAPGVEGTDPTRAYELVSSGDKHGALVAKGTVGQVGSGDSGFDYFMSGGLEGSEQVSVSTRFSASRSGDGVWSSDPLDAPQNNTKFQLDRVTGRSSDDLSRSVQLSRRALTPGAVEGQVNLYMQDNRTHQRTLIATTTSEDLWSGTIPGLGRSIPTDSTPDLKQILFRTAAALTDDAVAGEGTQLNLYRWDGSALHLVNVGLPPGAEAGSIDSLPHPGAISADGTKVFFTHKDNQTLYMRQNDEVTVPISVSHRSADAGDVKQGTFVASVDNGNIVFLKSASPLTDDSRASGLYDELYRYDVSTGALTNLTPSPDTDGAVVRSVLGVSKNGDSVYYVATGKVGVEGTSGGANLYLWHAGETKFVAALEPGGNEATGPFGYSMSPNGRFLAFSSYTSVTGYDNSGSRVACGEGVGNPAGRCMEVFVYDALTATLRCASCVEGRQPIGHSQVASQWVGFDGAVGDDGSVFFTTPEALTAGDVNGVDDVYEWRYGTITRISTGRDPASTGFAGATADGKDVFIFTNERLSELDGDQGELDVYTARVGGIARPPRPAQALCGGDVCQGALSERAAPPSIGSVAFIGPDTPLTGPGRAPVARVKPKVTLSKKTVSGTSFIVKVKVPVAGRIVIAGAGLRTVRRGVTKGSTASVRVSLSKKSAATLKRKHKLRVSARVSFTPTGGQAASASVSVTLTRPIRKSSARSASRAARQLNNEKGR